MFIDWEINEPQSSLNTVRFCEARQPSQAEIQGVEHNTRIGAAESSGIVGLFGTVSDSER
eukprot:m.18009 g.18009  ORF g.18009 m.18009 type:complete len:60 (-) comp5256_c0_seq1:1020-1199(-)